MRAIASSPPVAPRAGRQAPPPSPAPSRPERPWQDDVFYFAFTDRFADGDKTNNLDCDKSAPKKFHGGDWQGIIDHLDSLHDLGVSALWISPPFLNQADFLGMAGFHGYWPVDFDKTDPHFGSKEKLKELVAEAHKRGMRVVLDWVLNHTAYDHPWAKDPAKQDWFHHKGDMRENTLEDGNLFGLPDLRQENPEVTDWLIDMTKKWVRETGVDGLRLDAVRHFPKEFTARFSEEMKKEFGESFFILGEAYDPRPSLVGSFQKEAGLDSLYDFPLCNALRTVVGRNPHQGFIGRWLQARHIGPDFPADAWRVMHDRDYSGHHLHETLAQDGEYKDASSLVTLLENHDMPRFMTYAGDERRPRFQQAFSLLMTMRGIPCIYYGAEDGMGASYDDLRADKRDGADPEMRAFMKSWISLRATCPALRHGRQQELYWDKSTYAFTREDEHEKLLVVANLSDRPRSVELPIKTHRASDAFDGRRLDPSQPLQMEAFGTRVLRLDAPSETGPGPDSTGGRRDPMGVSETPR
jgi:alpha-amylase